jgi:hypothetical protein
MKVHPSESVLSIIHHGRDRDRLMALVYDQHKRDCGNWLMPHEEFDVSQRALAAAEKLTPPDDTRIRADSVIKYVDLDLIDSPGFLYDGHKIMAADLEFL